MPAARKAAAPCKNRLYLNVVYHPLQRGKSHRFCQVAVKPAFFCAPHILFAGIPRQGDKTRAVQVFICFDTHGNFISAHAWQADIAQDHIRLDALRFLKAVLPVVSQFGMEAHLGKHPAHQGRVIPVVLNNQYVQPAGGGMRLLFVGPPSGVHPGR